MSSPMTNQRDQNIDSFRKRTLLPVNFQQPSPTAAHHVSNRGLQGPSDMTLNPINPPSHQQIPFQAIKPESSPRPSTLARDAPFTMKKSREEPLRGVHNNIRTNWGLFPIGSTCQAVRLTAYQISTGQFSIPQPRCHALFTSFNTSRTVTIIDSTSPHPSYQVKAKIYASQPTQVFLQSLKPYLNAYNVKSGSVLVFAPGNTAFNATVTHFGPDTEEAQEFTREVLQERVKTKHVKTSSKLKGTRFEELHMRKEEEESSSDSDSVSIDLDSGFSNHDLKEMEEIHTTSKHVQHENPGSEATPFRKTTSSYHFRQRRAPINYDETYPEELLEIPHEGDTHVRSMTRQSRRRSKRNSKALNSCSPNQRNCPAPSVNHTDMKKPRGRTATNIAIPIFFRAKLRSSTRKDNRNRRKGIPERAHEL